MKYKFLISVAVLGILGMSIIPMRALATDSTSNLDIGDVSVVKINETLTDFDNEYGTFDKV
ncbi:hypothetical protein ACPTF7_15085, partial [Enterococcus faecalis]